MKPRGWVVGLAVSVVSMSWAACGNDDESVSSDSPARETTAIETSSPASDSDALVASNEAASNDPASGDAGSGDAGTDTGSGDAADSADSAEPSLGEYVLHGDGIGALRFGDGDEAVVASLTALLGAPSSDTGWQPNPSPCDEADTQARSVQYGDLYVEFVDVDDEFGTGRHWRSYVLFGPEGDSAPMGEFATADGVELGMTLADAQTIDPTIEAFDSEIQGRVWSAGGGGAEPSAERGHVVGGTLLDDGQNERIGSISAGLICVD